MKTLAVLLCYLPPFAACTSRFRATLAAKPQIEAGWNRYRRRHRVRVLRLCLPTRWPPHELRQRAWHLVNTDEGWKIVSVIWSINPFPAPETKHREERLS